MKTSLHGYKRNSPDVNKKVNVISSGNITMKGVDFKVKGVDNKGNTKIMEPGKDYKFPGNKVTETKYKNKDMHTLHNIKSSGKKPGNTTLPGINNTSSSSDSKHKQKGEVTNLTNPAPNKYSTGPMPDSPANQMDEGMMDEGMGGEEEMM